MTHTISHGFNSDISDDYRTNATVARQRALRAARLNNKVPPRHAPRFSIRAPKAAK